jgi:hypothetical protein
MQINRAKGLGALRKPLKVKFEGEEGVDEGGVQKEFFQLLVRRVLGSAWCGLPHGWSHARGRAPVSPRVRVLFKILTRSSCALVCVQRFHPMGLPAGVCV